MKKRPDKVVWKRVAENIVRHPSGTYYLSAKINGAKVRRSLKTENLDVAKMKRDDELARVRGLRAAADILTVGDALDLVGSRRMNKPSIKSNTVKYYGELLAILRLELPVKLAGGQWKHDDVRKWWESTGKQRGASIANNLLQWVRDIAEAIRDAGLRRDLPTAGLDLMPVPLTAVDSLPSKQTLAKIVAYMRAQKKNSRGRDESADMVEFFAWSGLRPMELRALEWKHVDNEWLTVKGPEEGTKNNLVRKVPINGPLAAVIARRRYDGAAGPVFSISSPVKSFRNACEACGIDALRLYDLRHIFATTSIESGVDILTVSRWLGHQDRGVLAMKTYGHLRDEHSLASAKKLVG